MSGTYARTREASGTVVRWIKPPGIPVLCEFHSLWTQISIADSAQMKWRTFIHTKSARHFLIRGALYLKMNMLHIENQPTTSLYPASDLLAAATGRFPKLCYLIIVRESVG